jgi:hypothetical protein
MKHRINRKQGGSGKGIAQVKEIPADKMGI